MTPTRVGVICDLREEGWHSMDLIADMLLDTLPMVAGAEIIATRLCPPMVPRWSRLPLIGGGPRARLGDRLTGRLWDYPRWLARRLADFDVFHVVDHSYAHLLRVLPPERTIVTCNDLDAILPALPGGASRFNPARVLASCVLDGLCRAARIACISQATRAELLATASRRDPQRPPHRAKSARWAPRRGSRVGVALALAPEHVSVVYLGVHPSCSPTPVPAYDGEIDRQLGPRRLEILHVGSTIPRKRIDVLLEILRGVRSVVEEIRLVHVGGPFTPAQRALAEKLGIADAVVELPYLERPVLAALYRRASVLVLPSDREGFGLPVVEAMACGTPVVASAIPALKEAGGDGAAYCSPGNVDEWIATVTDLLRQRRSPAAWESRRRESIAAAARFDWRFYAAEMAKLYLNLEPKI